MARKGSGRSGALGAVGCGGERVEQLGSLRGLADVEGAAGSFIEQQDDRAAGAAGEAPPIAGRADNACRAWPCRAAAYRAGWRLWCCGESPCRNDRPVSGWPGRVTAGKPLSHVDQAGRRRYELGLAEIPVLPLAGFVLFSGALVGAAGEFAGDLICHGPAPRRAPAGAGRAEDRCAGRVVRLRQAPQPESASGRPAGQRCRDGAVRPARS
jgi:hypothetical protein